MQLPSYCGESMKIVSQAVAIRQLRAIELQDTVLVVSLIWSRRGV